MGNELLCTQMCAGCSLKASDFFLFVFKKHFWERASCQDLSSKCLSNEIFVRLQRDNGQCLCFVFRRKGANAPNED